MDYEIQKTLILSTSHINEEESEILEALSSPHSPDIYDLIVHSHGTYGWNIYVADVLAPNQKMPNLNRLIKIAQSNDCAWLRLDCDGPVHDELQEFDW